MLGPPGGAALTLVKRQQAACESAGAEAGCVGVVVDLARRSVGIQPVLETNYL